MERSTIFAGLDLKGDGEEIKVLKKLERGFMIGLILLLLVFYGILNILERFPLLQNEIRDVISVPVPEPTLPEIVASPHSPAERRAAPALELHVLARVHCGVVHADLLALFDVLPSEQVESGDPGVRVAAVVDWLVG